jgi:FolB domain-containing protein
MSKISIVDLELHVHIGVPDEERAKPQRILMTVDMDHDFSSAIATDRVTKTIDYFQVSQRLMEFGKGRSWKLIEKLANDAGDMVLSEFQPATVTITVKKFVIPQAAYVSVSHTLYRKGSGMLKQAAWGIP